MALFWQLFGNRIIDKPHPILSTTQVHLITLECCDRCIEVVKYAYRNSSILFLILGFITNFAPVTAALATAYPAVIAALV